MTLAKPNDVLTQLNQVIAEAECLYTADQVAATAAAMAAAISQDLAANNPLLLCVMIGGMIPCSLLLRHLDFPLEVDYIHATRYRANTGSTLEWRSRPRIALTDRHVLIVDDILDEGITLSAIKDWCLEQGAASVRIAVLTVKLHDRNQTGLQADYQGLTVPDRYVFGAGMDYHSYCRNLPGIYAVRSE